MNTPFSIYVVIVMISHNVYFDKWGNSMQDAVITNGTEYKIIPLNKSRIYVIDTIGGVVRISHDSAGHIGVGMCIDDGDYGLSDTINIPIMDWKEAPNTTEPDNDDDQ